MRRIRPALAWIQLVFLLGGACMAQVWAGPAGIEIEVSSKGKPVAGARVLLRFREAPKGSFAVMTDAKGRAAVINLAPGAWNIEVSHEEFLSYVAAVTLQAGKKATETTSFLQATGAGRQAIRIKYHKANRAIGTPVDAPPPPVRATDPIPTPTPAPTPPEPEPEPVELREPDIPAPSPPTATPEPEPMEPPATTEPEPMEPQVELREPDIPTPSPAPAETPEVEAPEVVTEQLAPAVPEVTPPVEMPEPPEPMAEPVVEAVEELVEEVAEAPVDEPMTTPAAEAAMAEPPSAPVPPKTMEVEPEPVAEAPEMPEPAPEPMSEPEMEAPAEAEVEAPAPTTMPEPVESAPAPPAEDPPAPTAEPEMQTPEPPAPEMSEPETPEPEVVTPEPPPAPEPAPMPAPPAVETPVVGTPRMPEPAEAPTPEPPVAAAPSPQAPADSPADSPAESPADAEPPAAEPAPTPAPAPRAPSPSLRAYRDRTCPECKPGEWSAASVEVAAPLGSGGACPADAPDLARKAAHGVARAPVGSLTGFAGPAIGGVSPTALELLPGEARTGVDTALGWRNDSCRLLAVSIPKGAKFHGFRFEAADDSGQADCLGEQDCPIRDSRFLINPGIERGREVTVLYSVFENRSTDQERRARLTVYFVPASGWRP